MGGHRFGVPCHTCWLTSQCLVLISIQDALTFYKWRLVNRKFTNLILGPDLVGNMPLAPTLPPAELQQKWHYGSWLCPGAGEDTQLLSLTKHLIPPLCQQLQPGGAGPVTDFYRKDHGCHCFWLLHTIQLPTLILIWDSNLKIKIHTRSTQSSIK